MPLFKSVLLLIGYDIERGDMMNGLQSKEFDLLKIFINICESLNLNYFLVCGSALGAVKYGGFIPWDDDVDVALCREDYNIFCEKAQKFLPDGIFLQTYKTDRRYPCVFAKLRNSNTTYVEKTCKNISMNHGVYIDIFPLDGYPESTKLQNRLERKKFMYKLLLSCVYESNCSFKLKVLRKIFRMFGVHQRTHLILAKYEKLISAYPIQHSQICCNHGNWQEKLEYAPKEQYGMGTSMRFEGIDVCVPELYDEYLAQKYGDWKSDLPKEDQVGHHYFEIMDLNTPYIHYIK